MIPPEIIGYTLSSSVGGQLNTARHVSRNERWGHYSYLSRCYPQKLEHITFGDCALGYLVSPDPLKSVTLAIMLPLSELGSLREMPRTAVASFLPEVRWFDRIRVARKNKGIRFYFRKGFLIQPPTKALVQADSYTAVGRPDSWPYGAETLILFSFDVPLRSVPLVDRNLKAAASHDRTDTAHSTASREGRVQDTPEI